MAKNKPPIPVKIDTPSLDDCIKTIRQALQRQQTYSESLDQTIQMAAGNYYLYLKTLASIQKHAKVMYPVETREGSKAYKLHPDVEFVPTITRALQLSLKSLGLTLDTLALVEDDPLEKLSNKVSDMLNG
ncbi:MAG: hypothetical protein VZR01_05565 [Candidatus Cryptobacteroides sp.]|jgi:hypothetical protein|nr:hypothetical protein [Candidatus Cryptobacteroides sp.]